MQLNTTQMRSGYSRKILNLRSIVVMPLHLHVRACIGYIGSIESLQQKKNILQAQHMHGLVEAYKSKNEYWHPGHKNVGD